MTNIFWEKDEENPEKNCQEQAGRGGRGRDGASNGRGEAEHPGKS